jgi:hypothetical protein
MHNQYSARRRGIEELNLQEEESMIETKEAPINQSITSAEAGQRGACLGQTAGRLIGAKDQLARGAGAGCGQWRGSAAIWTELVSGGICILLFISTFKKI